MSKAEVTVEQLPKHQIAEGIFTCTHPLNPLDVMFTNQVMSYLLLFRGSIVINSAVKRFTVVQIYCKPSPSLTHGEG